MIRVATSGFSFKDWLGKVYPPDLSEREMLDYYERKLGFDCTELNYTFYSMPTRPTMSRLLERTREGFEFLVRSHSDMTHKIWRDDARTELRDNQEVFDRFRFGIDPLVRSGRLGCLLIQFPIFFIPGPENLAYLESCRRRLPDVPLAVEFRNKAWNREETYAFLHEHNLANCIVDEPQMRGLMPFVPRLTSDIGYFRLHGRSANWFGQDKARRYDYLYSDKELKEFIPHIRRVSEQSRVTYVAFNNCHAGAAARNALMTRQFLDLLNAGELNRAQQEALSGEVSPRSPGLGF
jgi:uncharacterized protein YecE (DUF72 family)